MYFKLLKYVTYVRMSTDDDNWMAFLVFVEFFIIMLLIMFVF